MDGGTGGSQVEKLFSLLIESGAVYCAIWVSLRHTKRLTSLNRIDTKHSLAGRRRCLASLGIQARLAVASRGTLPRHIRPDVPRRTRARNRTFNHQCIPRLGLGEKSLTLYHFQILGHLPRVHHRPRCFTAIAHREGSHSQRHPHAAPQHHFF